MIHIKSRIYFDITDLLDYALENTSLSGIQRMSTMMLNRIVNTHGAGAVRLLFYDQTSSSIRWIAADYFAGSFRFDPKHFLAQFGVSHAQGMPLKSYLRGKYRGRMKRSLHGLRLRLINLLDGGNTFAKRKIRSEGKARPAQTTTGSPLKARAGDIVFVPGATWNCPDYIDQLKELTSHGVRLVQFVHDLIPLIACEHYSGKPSLRFANWLESVTSIASAILVNSEATRRDLQKYLCDARRNIPDIAIVPLAHQFHELQRPCGLQLARRIDHVTQPEGSVAHLVGSAWREPYVLAVGTLEMRKNLHRLVRVWLDLQREKGDDLPRLVIAGKLGFRHEDIYDFLRRHRHLAARVTIVERPDDDALADLYRSALFTVFPSYYEGWGLPVGESLWFGKPVVASRSSSIPEVGGDLVDYFDPNSNEQMKGVLERMVFNSRYRHERTAKILGADLRSWDDVADDLWTSLNQFTPVDREIHRSSAA